MSKVRQIAEGFFNNLTNRKEELFEERIKICRQCKLHYIDPVFGEMCNPTLYLNPETNEVSNKKREGFTGGCGCILNLKCRVPDANCPVNKW